MAHKTVFDIMKDESAMKNHRDQWFRALTIRNENGAEHVNKDLDFEAFETQCVGPMELSILKTMSVPENFIITRAGQNRLRLRITAYVEAEQGSRQADNETSQYIDFERNTPWELRPASAAVNYARNNDIVSQGDVANHAKVVTAIAGMPIIDFDKLVRSTINDRVSRTNNLEHLFAKGYLMLNDYNLATMFNRTSWQADDDFTIDTVPNCPPDGRLGLIKTRAIVVDSEGFTAEELALLGVMAGEYPSVKYAGDNVYNCVNMRADDLVIVSKGRIDIALTWAWSSPLRLYNLMCQVALKLDCTRDMFRAFSQMRSVPHIMQDICGNVSASSWSSTFPLGTSTLRAWGDHRPRISRMVRSAGYFACSASLVADALIGEAMELITTLQMEELGCYGGKLIKVTERPILGDTLMAGLMRDHGLNSPNVEINSLLGAWYTVNGFTMAVSLGSSIKEYVMNKAEGLRNQTGDVKFPMLLECLPVLPMTNNSWATLRGWRGEFPILERTDEAKLEARAQTAVFTWAMGVRNKRPIAGRMRPKKHVTVLGGQEEKFLSGRGGSWKITHVGFSIKDEFVDRTDEYQVTTRALEKLKYTGSYTKIVYNTTEGWVELKDNPDTLSRARESVKHTHSAIIPKPKAQVVPVGAHKSNKSSDTTNSSSLNTFPKPWPTTPIKPTSRLSVSEAGEPIVAEHIVDGQHTNRLARPLGQNTELEFGRGEDTTIREAILISAAARGINIDLNHAEASDVGGYADFLATSGLGLQLLDIHTGQVIHYNPDEGKQIAIGTENGKYFMVDAVGNHKATVHHR